MVFVTTLAGDEETSTTRRLRCLVLDTSPFKFNHSTEAKTTDLGVILDAQLTMSIHATAFRRSTLYQPRQLQPVV